jgi:predicted small secreted protein
MERVRRGLTGVVALVAAAGLLTACGTASGSSRDTMTW